MERSADDGVGGGYDDRDDDDDGGGGDRCAHAAWLVAAASICPASRALGGGPTLESCRAYASDTPCACPPVGHLLGRGQRSVFFYYHYYFFIIIIIFSPPPLSSFFFFTIVIFVRRSCVLACVRRVRNLSWKTRVARSGRSAVFCADRSFVVRVIVAVTRCPCSITTRWAYTQVPCGRRRRRTATGRCRRYGPGDRRYASPNTGRFRCSNGLFALG